jgi:hypothetical protein
MACGEKLAGRVRDLLKGKRAITGKEMSGAL